MDKRILVALLTLFSVCALSAQPRKGFNPAKFEADLEQFITEDACLSPTEALRFFPVYREMRRKQMAFFGEDRRYRHVDTSDDKACEVAIKRHDEIDIQIKKIQQAYHNKFMKILPASKVFKILRSEDRFHRQMFKKAARHDRKRR